MTKKKEYGNSSITSLKGADRVRLKPAVIFGSDGLDACVHQFFEIFSNSIDEAKSGYGDTITVLINSDNSVSIIDRGRGIPLDWNEKEQRYNWDLCLNEMYAGGKYSIDDDEDYDIGTLGTNGLGLASSQYASEYMKVISYRDGYRYEMNFEKGCPVGELIKVELTENKSRTGTEITYKADSEVFTETEIPFELLKELIKEQAVVAKGIYFQLGYSEEQNMVQFYYQKGIEDHIVELAQEKNITEVIRIEKMGAGRDAEDRPEYKAKFELVFAFNNEHPQQLFFHNSSKLEYGGSPLKAVRSAMVSVIDKYLKDTNKYNKSEKKITYVDIEDSLLLECSSFSTSTSYENQTKKAITNKFVGDLIQDGIKEELSIYFAENPIDAEKICGQVLVNMRARTKAEKTRINVRKALGEKISIISKIPNLIECKSKDRTKNILCICEGKSALSGIIAGRTDVHAIYPIRGKITNCLKASEEQIFKSEVVLGLLRALGCGVELKSKHNKENGNFDISMLRYSKVYFIVDSDVDGIGSIMPLLLTMFHRLLPTLIAEGLIFICETPKYEVEYNNEEYYATNDEELDNIKEQLKGKKYKVNYIKGLAELSEQAMQMCLAEGYAGVKQIKMTDVEKSIEMLELFMGNDTSQRKEYILENFDTYRGEVC